MYKSDNASVRIFGELNAAIGYGATLDYPFTIDRVNMKSNYSFSDANSKTKHSFMLGVQRDSRVGIGFNVSGVFGEATLGLGETTLTGYLTNNSIIYTYYPNFRQLYAGYDFGKGGKILVGKTELNTSMGGFISDIANEEEGLWGFGAPRNSIRILQVRYEVAGFSIAVSPIGSKIPRFSLAYEYSSDRLRAKIAGAYDCVNDNCGANQTLTKKHTAYITAGIKPYFGKNYKTYLSFTLSYGLNYGQIYYKPYINQNLSGYGNLNLIETQQSSYSNGSYVVINYRTLGTSDENIYATALEFGHNFTDKVALKIGLGYQIAKSYARTYKKYDMLHSFGGFIQVPCKINDYFTLIPQTGSRIIVREDISNTNANEMKFDFISNSMALLLMKFTF